MGEQQENHDNDAYTRIQGKDVLHRFLFVFSKSVRAVSSVVPLVLFFDGLQWSDPSSLSLLQVILETPPEDNDRMSSLLVICAFRDEGL
jgi:predicted ATPase